ncbi:MAG: hypothetical protein WC820_01555 [Spirochaetales bacterium]|jgi:murein DD-endopeptidase MepM/ murein hydrolase activator NlpD
MNVIKNGVITAPFDQMRPLSVKPEKRWYKHEALDIAAGDGLARSPVKGIARGYIIIRGSGWDEKEKPSILEIPWHNYFEDVFGGIIVIEEDKTHRMHILAHFWADILLDGSAKATVDFHYGDHIETIKKTPLPARILRTVKVPVEAGDILGPVGNAGYVEGPTGIHVHWEIHHSIKKIDDRGARINPGEYME